MISDMVNTLEGTLKSDFVWVLKIQPDLRALQ